MPTLDKLPVEILFLVAKKLGPSRGLANLVRTNKDLHGVLNDELYRLEIKTSGSAGFYEAIEMADVRRVKAYIDESAKALGFDWKAIAQEALIFAIDNIKPTIVELLLEKGEDADCQNSIFVNLAFTNAPCGIVNTALTIPIRRALKAIDYAEATKDMKASIDTLSILLSHGADPDAILDDALRMRLPIPIRTLITFGADIFKTFPLGGTALHFICETFNWVSTSERHLYVTSWMLMEAGVDKHAQNDNGWTALHLYLYNKVNCNHRQRHLWRCDSCDIGGEFYEIDEGLIELLAAEETPKCMTWKGIAEHILKEFKGIEGSTLRQSVRQI